MNRIVLSLDEFNNLADQVLIIIKESVTDESIKVEKDAVSSLVDIHININTELKQPCSEIMISLDRDQVDMYIGEYHWEFDDNFELAKKVIGNYVKAAAENKLKESKVSVLGITLSKKLVIEN